MEHSEICETIPSTAKVSFIEYRTMKKPCVDVHKRNLKLCMEGCKKSSKLCSLGQVVSSAVLSRTLEWHRVFAGNFHL